jgi:hypothetical protein
MQTEPSNAEPPKCKRGRFHVRLRTLFLIALLVVGCLYIAYEHKIVVDRREWLGTHPVVSRRIGTLDSLRKFSPGDRTKQPSWFRVYALGDVARQWVIVPASAPTAETQVAAALFPEADILVGPPD